MSTNGNGKTERVYSSSEMNAVTPEQNRAQLRPFVDGIDRASDWMEPQKHSQLSAAQRAKLTDDMVAAIQEQRKQINALTQAVAQLQRGLGHARGDHQRLEINLAQAGVLSYDINTDTWPSPRFVKMEYEVNHNFGIVLRPTFWGRLKWFWTGR